MSPNVTAAAVPQPPGRRWRRTHLVRRGYRSYSQKTWPALNRNKLKKSGLTPTPFFPANSKLIPSLAQIATWGISEQNQRAFLYGFTTADLKALKALPVYDRSIRMSSLSVPLHPLFARENWFSPDNAPKHLAFDELDDGTPLTAANDTIWYVLQPCLQLATLFLNNTGLWPWWDALFFGEFRDLDQDEFPPSEAGRAIGQTTYSFHRRGAAEAFKDMERSKRYMLQMVGRIRFGIWHDRTNTLSQLSSGNLGICGQTERSALYPWISVNISNHHVGRLLREDLNTSQKLYAQFWLAEAIVHEVAHATFMHMSLVDGRASIIDNEPYFEDERRDELGFSFCHSVMGKLIHRDLHLMGGLTPKMPAAGAFARDWPHDGDYSSSGANPTSSSEMLHTTEWPVPTSWISQVWQQPFWDRYVQTYGTEALHIGPLTWGHRRSVLADLTDFHIPQDRVFGRALQDADIIINNSMTEAERRAAELTNAHLSHGRRILNSINNKVLRGPSLAKHHDANFMEPGHIEIPQHDAPGFESDGESCDSRSTYDTQEDERREFGWQFDSRDIPAREADIEEFSGASTSSND